MKRETMAAAAAMVAVLVAPSAASAATTHFEGEGKDDPKVRVSFELNQRDDGSLRVKEFQVSNHKLRCSNGDRFRLGFPFEFGGMDVNREGEFGRRYESNVSKERLEGKLRRRESTSYVRASGLFSQTIRTDGQGNPDPSGDVKCRTGDVEWKARVE